MKPDTENIYQRKINQVIDYINANLHLPLRLDIIAGQVNVSEQQLLRIMKGALNESLYAYVARQRVERAVLYMHTEDMSLADLASRVGYDNPQSFSKAFKKQFSVSPKAYMDKLRARLREETEKWSNASVGKEIIPSGMFGTIRLQKGKYAVYTLKGSYAGLQELYNTIKFALWVYGDKIQWKNITKKAMQCDNSWNKSAQIYLDLYRELTNVD